jgi:carboxyl-terminal processing protease
MILTTDNYRNMKKVSGILLLLVFFFTGYHAIAQPPVNNSFDILKNLDIYATCIKELNEHYVDVINPGELTKTGIDAMLNSLDPYTNYIPESEIEDYKFITTGEYGGIGALIHQQGDYVVISEPYEGSPAQKSDIRAGDKILEINGQSAKGKSYSDVSTILKGQAGTPISMKLLRDGVDKPIEKNINREIIKVDNIPYSGIVSKNIGYIKLNSFTQNAGQEVKQAFLKLKEGNDLKGVIIDLRGNGGGLLDEAVNITNIFIDKGQEVVSTKGKMPDKNFTHRTLYPPTDLNIPLVILVDKQSASASEILAGSIQDLDRGVIIGQRTYGKGLVQNVIPLSFNAQMKVTVAKYYIPSGRCIQAIDYSHKNKQGGFALYPDSLIKPFKTKDGRTVYEGRGIKPDVLTPPISYSNIAMSLYTKYVIFDYATKFTREHASIPPAGEFQITDSIFSDFEKFIAGKNYDYTTKSEQALEDLKKNAQTENYFNAIKSEYDALKAQMSNDKKGDLQKFKNQIKDLLRVEIAGRYYYQKGKVKSSLENDSDLAEAVKTLSDPGLYKSIIAGTYKQPSPPEDKPSDNPDSDDN